MKKEPLFRDSFLYFCLLVACSIGYLDTEKASAILSLPDYLSCLFLLPLGYADELPQPKERKAVREVSFYNKWC